MISDLLSRACLKKAFCKMCVTICGRFCPDEGAVAAEAKKQILDFYKQDPENAKKQFGAEPFELKNILKNWPKVGSVSLSPRGDWRMPSDASCTMWLHEAENL